MKNFLLGRFRLFAFFTATISAIFAKTGYHFEVEDQFILFLEGTRRAIPELWKNDQFVTKAPQPHLIFDLIVELGVRYNCLNVLMFLFWIGSVLIIAKSCHLLSEKFFPDRWWLGLFLPILVGVADIGAIGSSSLLLGWALPHMLGGALVLLCFVAISTERTKLALLTLVAASFIHIQHAALAAGVLVLRELFLIFYTDLKWDKKTTIKIAETSLFSFIVAAAIASLRGLTDNGDDFIRICEKYIPHHCDPIQWDTRYLLLSYFIIFLGFRLSRRLYKNAQITNKRENLSFSFIVGSTTFILAFCLTCDFINLEFIAWFAKRFNIYRLGSLVQWWAAAEILFSVFAINRSHSWRKSITAYFLTVVWCLQSIWSQRPEQVRPLVSYFDESTPALYLAVAFVLIALSLLERAHENKKISPSLFKRVAIAMGLIILNFMGNRIYLVFETSDTHLLPKIIGQKIQEVVPLDGVIAVNFEANWIRYLSRRAIVADFKGIPYGGQALTDWETRINDFEMVFSSKASDSSIRSFVEKYKVTDIIVGPQVPSLKELEKTYGEPLSLTIANLEIILFRTSSNHKH